MVVQEGMWHWVLWCTFVCNPSTEVGGLRQKDREFEASLSYIERPYLKNKPKRRDVACC
jgi:hypothetical protein